MEGGQATLEEGLVDEVALLGVEVDHVGDVVDADGVKSVLWIVEGRGEGRHVRYLLAVGFRDDQVVDLVVAYGGRGPDDAAEEDEALPALLVVLGIIERIEQVERSTTPPLLAEGFEVGAGEFLENQTALDEIGRGLVVHVAGNEMVGRTPEDRLQLLLLPIAHDEEGEFVTNLPGPAHKVAPDEAPVGWILVISAAIDCMPVHGEENVTLFQAAFVRAGFAVRKVISLDAALDADAVVLANPNNPDGRRFSSGELADFAQSRGNRMTVIDEAFADCHPDVSVAGRAGAIPGLLVLRSFGKFFGLAGVRLGFAFAAKPVAKALAEALGPWPVSGPALEIAIHAFASPDIMSEQRAEIERCHALTAEAVRTSGIPVVGQTALFFLLDVGDGAAARDTLASQHILTRAFDHSPRRLRLGLVANESEAERLTRGLKAITS